MKDKLTFTRLGPALIKLRSWAHLHRISFGNPEKAANIANDIIATHLITRLCPPNGTFLDVGGHIGSVFGAVHRHDPSIKIFAVEADPTKAKRLIENFPNCQIFDCAVGDDTGVVQLYIDAQRPGFTSLADRSRNAKQQDVPLKRLDELIPDDIVDLIKIDIEGAEVAALKGAAELIKRSRPTIMFESTELETNSLGFAAKDVWEWCDAADFDVVTPDRVAHNAPALSLETFLDAHEYPMRSLNFFAVPREKRTVVRDAARKVLRVSA